MKPRRSSKQCGPQHWMPVAITLALSGPAWASDPPDSRTNPSNSHIETVDSTLAGGDYNVRHVDTPSGGYPTVTQLSSNSADDNGPRVSIGSSGATSVVWWRDGATDEVYYRRRSAPNTSFGSEVRISDGSEHSRSPRIAYDGGSVWIAYEVTTSGQTGIAATGTEDGEPFPGRTIVGSTSYAGDRDLLVHSESGHVWITWIDSSSQVAWSEYDKRASVWGQVGNESYSNDSVPEARGRVRATVLAN